MGEGHQWISDSCHPYAVGFLRAGGWNIQTYLIRLLLLFAPSCTEWRLPSLHWKIRSGQSFFVRSWTAGLPVLHSCCPSGYCRLTERPADILPGLCCKQELYRSCCYALHESISVLPMRNKHPLSPQGSADATFFGLIWREHQRYYRCAWSLWSYCMLPEQSSLWPHPDRRTLWILQKAFWHGPSSLRL